MTKSENTGDETELSFLINFSRGSKSRKKILKALFYGSKSCNQIANELGLNWRTTYRHLQILEKEVLVKSFGFGQRKLYKLSLSGEAAIKCYMKGKTVLSNKKAGG